MVVPAVPRASILEMAQGQHELQEIELAQPYVYLLRISIFVLILKNHVTMLIESVTELRSVEPLPARIKQCHVAFFFVHLHFLCIHLTTKLDLQDWNHVVKTVLIVIASHPLHPAF